MQKLTYTNSRGESIVFSHRPPFILSKIEGLGDVDADIQRQKSPYQDGETHIDTILEPRYISMEISIVARKNIDEYRRYLSKIMNPKFDGILKYEDGSIVREIVCTNEHVPNYPSKSQSFQLAIVNLIAPNPYWQSQEETTEPLAAFIPKFTFPFTFPVKFWERGSQATLINDGDVPAPIEIEFNGPATNPEVINLTTGEFIRVRRELKEGEKLIINTSEGRDRKVIIDRGNGVIENAWGYIDIWESTLFSLDVGENVISYGALNSGGQALVYVSFRKLYVGV